LKEWFPGKPSISLFKRSDKGEKLTKSLLFEREASWAITLFLSISLFKKSDKREKHSLKFYSLKEIFTQIVFFERVASLEITIFLSISLFKKSDKI
jgi:hypothetical protein